MKTTLITLFILGCLFSASTTEIHAQIKRAYIPLKEFGNDTLAFLMGNFNSLESSNPFKEYHKGRKLNTFIKDISKDLPIRAFRFITNGETSLSYIEFYYYSPCQIKEKNAKNIVVPCIQINIYINSTNPVYKEIINENINLKEELMEWDNKYLNVLNKINLEYFFVNQYYKNTDDMERHEIMEMD